MTDRQRKQTWRAVLAATALGCLTLFLYAWKLNEAPVYLHHDEIFFGLQADSIHTTGRDFNGRLLPVYFEMMPGNWFQPVIVYAMTGVLAWLPLGTATIRLTSALVAALNVVLLYAVAQTLFKRPSLAALAAIFLMLTPAHFIHGRIAMDYLYPVPFILGWLLCLLTFLERRRPWILLVGTAILGLGFYSYLAAVVMMPIYLALTLVVLARAGFTRRTHLVALAGFALAILPAVVFLLQHPTMIADFSHRYRLVDPAKTAPTAGVIQRASLYWEFFNPSFLFFSGGSHMTSTTRQAGVFLLPLAVFLPVGIARAAARPIGNPSLVLLAGFFTGPVAALLIREPGAIDRMLNILPFAILLAVSGADALLNGARRARAAALALLVCLPLQFTYFAFDYFTAYPLRSFTWFEQNIQGAMDAMARQDRERGVPAFYFDRKVDYIQFHWKWFLTLDGRSELLQRTVFYDPQTLDVASVPAGAVLMATHADMNPVASTPALRKIADVVEPTGDISFHVFVKQ